jgi:hypothetical protein
MQEKVKSRRGIITDSTNSSFYCAPMYFVISAKVIGERIKDARESCLMILKAYVMDGGQNPSIFGRPLLKLVIVGTTT